MIGIKGVNTYIQGKIVITVIESNMFLLFTLHCLKAVAAFVFRMRIIKTFYVPSYCKVLQSNNIMSNDHNGIMGFVWIRISF